MSTESQLRRMTRNGWEAISTNVRKLQFTFTFQVTFVLVISFFLGNAFLYETASRRLYQNQERLFRDRVLYLSNVIMAWEKDIRDTLEFVSANPSVRTLDPKVLDEVLSPLFNQSPSRRWKVWRADGKLLLSSTPTNNIRLNEKRNLKSQNFLRALNGKFNYGVSSVLAGARLEGCLETSMPILPDATGTAKTAKPIGVISFCLPFSKIGDDSGLIRSDVISSTDTSRNNSAIQTNEQSDGLIEINRGQHKGKIFFLISPSGHMVFPTVRNNRFDHVSLLSPKRIKNSSWYPFVKASINPDKIDHFQNVKVNGYSYYMYSHRISDQWTAVSVMDEDSILEPLRKNLFGLMLVQAISLLVTSVAIYFVCRQLTKPLKAVVQTVSDLSDLSIPGEQPRSLSDSSIIEVRQVSQAINRLSFAMDSFGRYLPKEVVRTVLASKQSARLGGSSKELVVLFTDIKDFTSYSESIEATTLLSHLNDYLTALTSAILKTSGTIDKYIGDSIMAFWGAPAPLESPATLACSAALAIRDETNRINQQWEKAGLKLRFDTRVGINLGPVIVGNVGSEERFNYTVIGDSVNLASRLESTNKLYGTDILVSRSIVNAVAKESGDQRFLFQLLDRVKVKGKQLSSDIYLLLGSGDQFTSDQISDLETANEIMTHALDFGDEEGLRHIACLPQEQQQGPNVERLRLLLQQRLQANS